MAEAWNTVKNKAQELGAQMGNAVADAAERAKGATANMSKKAQDLASQAVNSAEAAGTYMGQKADEFTTDVGGRMKAAGDAIRDNSPTDGALGQASARVASSLQDTGDFLQREGVGGIGCQITKMIKEHPIPSILMGIGLGFLIAHATSDRRG